MTRPSADRLFDHRSEVPSEFDAIARRYDLLSGLNPGYQHHLELSAQRLRARPLGRLLDLCCGTGRSTEALVRAFPDAEVVGLDGSAGMLEVARRKPRLRHVRFVQGDAMDPRAAGVEGPFDGVMMAYGIRNMPDVDRSLAVVRDLLAPGGRVVFHEYSVADSELAKLVWNVVVRTIIIPFGRLTSPRTDIYKYLRESVLHFDGVSAFEARLRRAGFEEVQTLPMDGWQRGIVHSFVASRPR